jgi:hypothetical protein
VLTAGDAETLMETLTLPVAEAGSEGTKLADPLAVKDGDDSVDGDSDADVETLADAMGDDGTAGGSASVHVG